MSIHKDHRTRIKDRFENQGLDYFEEHQVLELLLFYAIPRVDTNVVAHRLIERFKTFDAVLDAPLKELEKVEGIGHNAAVFLRLVREVGRYYQIKMNEKKEQIMHSLDDCRKYLVPYFDGSRVEKVYLLCLDGKGKVLSCRLVNEGSVNCTEISIRKIVDVALTENATSVVLAHNHPSGFALPSLPDVQITLRLIQALQHVEVVMADHVIVTGGDSISLVQDRFIDESLCQNVFGG